MGRRERIAIPGLVAAHHSKTFARALSRTLYQKGSAAIPAWRGRVSVASAVASGAVVNTDLLPRQLPFLASDRGNESGAIYHSENGDRWLLCRGEDGRVFVLHKANVSSGGTATKIEIGDFLGRGKAGPEHQALARLIGSLVDKD